MVEVPLAEPTRSAEGSSAAESDRLARFEARLAADQQIEPNEWMPDQYRRIVQRLIAQHAHAEVLVTLPESLWLRRAPTLRRKLGLLAKLQDECGHGLYLYAAAETLGSAREELVGDLIAGRTKYSSSLNYPALTWADMGAIGWLVDGAAFVSQLPIRNSSFGPYARAMIRICTEETFHLRQGYEMLTALARGTPAQQAMAQDAIDRWWWPVLMMFGPHDRDSLNVATAMRWKLKRASNDDLRQRFVDAVVPQLHALGLTVPDPQLARDEATGRWRIGPIDWSELGRVVAGNGPCNRQRLKERRRIEADGAWVREAALAHARKRAARRVAEQAKAAE